MDQQYPPAPPAPSPTKTNVLAIISLVAGILGLLAICASGLTAIIPVIGLVVAICNGILAIGALVMGFIGMNQNKTTGQKGRVMAIIGLVLGIVALLAACLIGIAPSILVGILGPSIGNVFSGINNSLMMP